MSDQTTNPQRISDHTISKEVMNNFIERLVDKYKYRPLPKDIASGAMAFYSDNLNGFDDPNRPLTINGVKVANNFERVVIGHYGAFVEFSDQDDNLLVKFKVKKGQEWRLDEKYLKEKNLSIKYIWLEYSNGEENIKVYKQLATVKYADYKPDMYYISVMDFDKIR